MNDLLEEITTALADLLQSGAASCQEGTARRLLLLSARCENCGLHTGSALLAQVHTLLQEQRHRVEGVSPLPLAAAVSRAVRYAALCKKKLTLDRIEQEFLEQESQTEDEG